LDDERLKQGRHFGKDYFDDLLERIREIRTSEGRYYQKITDIYAECSSDYDAKSDSTKLFFKMVQNMMRIAVTHHRPLKSYIRGLMLRDQTVPFFDPQSYSGGVMRKRRSSPNAYL